MSAHNTVVRVGALNTSRQLFNFVTIFVVVVVVIIIITIGIQFTRLYRLPVQSSYEIIAAYKYINIKNINIAGTYNDFVICAQLEYNF